jgi:hypothetical protein
VKVESGPEWSGQGTGVTRAAGRAVPSALSEGESRVGARGLSRPLLVDAQALANLARRLLIACRGGQVERSSCTIGNFPKALR